MKSGQYVKHTAKNHCRGGSHCAEKRRVRWILVIGHDDFSATRD